MFLISDGSDLKGVTKVLDIKYMQMLRMAMRVVSAWPSKAFGDTPTKFEVIGAYYLITLNCVCLVMSNVYLRNSVGKMGFVELGHSYITTFMNAVSVTRNILIFSKSYRDISRDFVTKIHLFNRKDESEYAMKTHLDIHKMCHFLTSYVLFAMVNGIIMFNLAPVLNNISKGAYRADRAERNITLEQSVYLQHPYDYTTNFKGYLVVFVFNWYMSVICSVMICSYDLYLSFLIFHVWGNLKILLYNLDNFPRPSMTDVVYGIQIEWYSKEESRQVFLKLRDLAKHHSLIIDFIRNISSTFGFVLFVYMGFHQICGCLLLLECSALDVSAMLRYGPLTVILFHQLIQISVTFELLNAMILKTSLSYYVILKTFATED